MPATDYQIKQETADDWWEVEALFDHSFAPGREALSSYRLRDGVSPVAALCLVARDADGILAGAVRHWPVTVAGQKALLLGPIAVHSTRQGEGLGALLMGRAVDIARHAGWSRIMLVGDYQYYGRYGFFRLEDVVMPPPTNPERVLGLALEREAWSGISGPVVAAR